MGDKTEEGRACGNIGIAYDSLGNFKTAIDYHERCLDIAKDVENKTVEGMGYGNLGIAYSNLRDFKTAIDYREVYLKRSKSCLFELTETALRIQGLCLKNIEKIVTKVL